MSLSLVPESIPYKQSPYEGERTLAGRWLGGEGASPRVVLPPGLGQCLVRPPDLPLLGGLQGSTPHPPAQFGESGNFPGSRGGDLAHPPRATLLGLEEV